MEPSFDTVDRESLLLVLFLFLFLFFYEYMYNMFRSNTKLGNDNRTRGGGHIHTDACHLPKLRARYRSLAFYTPSAGSQIRE